MQWSRTLAAAALTAAAVAGDANAQIRGSEAATVSQTIDGTTITIEYSRPRAAGRELFGSLVAWDQPWTGANWATTIEVSKDVRINGTDVPAGKYSLWWIPQQDRWSVFLHPDTKLFHFQKPEPKPEYITMQAQPQRAPHSELLTWSFPAVTGDAATIQMQWGTTAVPLSIVVQPSRPVALEPAQRARFVGAYDMSLMEGIGWPTSGRFEIWEMNGMLRGRLPFPIHPGDELEFDLVPAGQNRFSPGIYRDGKLFNVEMGATFEFDVAGNQATAVRIRGIEGTVFGQGQRAG